MEDAEGEIPSDSKERSQWNLTSVAQFARDYDAVVKALDGMLPASTQVFVGTVPHVTIPPITTGVGHFDGRYFDAYTRGLRIVGIGQSRVLAALAVDPSGPACNLTPSGGATWPRRPLML